MIFPPRLTKSTTDFSHTLNQLLVKQIDAVAYGKDRRKKKKKKKNGASTPESSSSESSVESVSTEVSPIEGLDSSSSSSSD